MIWLKIRFEIFLQRYDFFVSLQYLNVKRTKSYALLFWGYLSHKLNYKNKKNSA